MTEPTSLDSPSEPRRPLSAYNLFFLFQRDRIVHDKDLREESVELDYLARLSHAHKVRPKRPHRKSHGRIGFLELARTCGRRWKELSPAARQVFERQALIEKEEYERKKSAILRMVGSKNNRLQELPSFHGVQRGTRKMNDNALECSSSSDFSLRLQMRRGDYIATAVTSNRQANFQEPQQSSRASPHVRTPPMVHTALTDEESLDSDPLADDPLAVLAELHKDVRATIASILGNDALQSGVQMLRGNPRRSVTPERSTQATTTLDKLLSQCHGNQHCAIPSRQTMMKKTSSCMDFFNFHGYSVDSLEDQVDLDNLFDS